MFRTTGDERSRSYEEFNETKAEKQSKNLFSDLLNTL